MTEGQAFCHGPFVMSRQGNEDAKGREGQRVHSERSAFILSAAGLRTFCLALILEKAGCERGGLGLK